MLINGVAHISGDIPAVNGLVRMIDQMIPVSNPSINSTQCFSSYYKLGRMILEYNYANSYC